MQITRQLFFHRTTQFQHRSAQFIAQKVSDWTHAAIAEVIDIVDFTSAGTGIRADERQQVVQGAEVIADGQDAAVTFGLQLAIDTEATNRTKIVAAFVEEAVAEEFANLGFISWVARAKAAINTKQRFFVAGGFVFTQGVEQNVVRLGASDDHFQAFNAQTLEIFEAVFRQHFARLGEEFARLFVDHVISQDTTNGFFFGALACNGNHIGLEETTNDGRSRAEIFIHRTQEAGRDDLGALVDLDLQNVVGGLLDLNPRTAFGDDAARIRTATRSPGFRRKVYARRALNLRNDRTFGTVDDEFATANTNWEIADVDVFFEHVSERRMVLTADANLHL